MAGRAFQGKEDIPEEVGESALGGGVEPAGQHGCKAESSGEEGRARRTRHTQAFALREGSSLRKLQR